MSPLFPCAIFHPHRVSYKDFSRETFATVSKRKRWLSSLLPPRECPPVRPPLSPADVSW